MNILLWKFCLIFLEINWLKLSASKLCKLFVILLFILNTFGFVLELYFLFNVVLLFETKNSSIFLLILADALTCSFVFCSCSNSKRFKLLNFNTVFLWVIYYIKNITNIIFEAILVKFKIWKFSCIWNIANTILIISQQWQTLLLRILGYNYELAWIFLGFLRCWSY